MNSKNYGATGLYACPICGTFYKLDGLSPMEAYNKHFTESCKGNPRNRKKYPEFDSRVGWRSRGKRK